MRRERTEEECLRRVQGALQARRHRSAIGAAVLLVLTIPYLGVLAAGYVGPAIGAILSVLRLGSATRRIIWPMQAGWRSRSLAAAVGGLHDPGSIRAVVGLLRYDCSRRVHAAAMDRLGEMLPSAPAASMGMDQNELSALLMALCRPDREDHGCYCVAVLDLFARVGYQRALGAARELAEGSPDPPVREAAARCRDRLLEVQADAKRSGTLLRPAGAPAGETLLRPAAPANRDDAALLRPVQQEEEEAEANQEAT